MNASQLEEPAHFFEPENEILLQDQNEQPHQKNFSFALVSTNPNGHQAPAQRYQPSNLRDSNTFNDYSQLLTHPVVNAFRSKKESMDSQISGSRVGRVESKESTQRGIKSNAYSNTKNRPLGGFLGTNDSQNQRSSMKSQQSLQQQQRDHPRFIDTQPLPKNSLTIQSGIKDSMKTASLDNDENQPLVRIANYEKSIFSELDEKQLASITSGKNQTLAQQTILDQVLSKDLRVKSRYSFGNSKQFVEHLNKPAIMEQIPIIPRPSQSKVNRIRVSRPKTSEKNRNKNNLFKDQFSMMFSLFPEAQTQSSLQQSHKKIRIPAVTEQQNATFSNDQASVEQLSNLRRKHSFTDQRNLNNWVRPGTQPNGSGRNQSNKVFAPISQEIDLNLPTDFINTMSSTQISNFIRAKSSQAGMRPQTTYLQNRLNQNHTTIDADTSHMVLNTEQETGQKSLNNQHFSGNIQNLYFDGGSTNSGDLTKLIRPLTAGLLPSRKAGRKNQTLLESIQQANLFNNSDLEILTQPESNKYLNIKDALSFLNIQNQSGDKYDKLDMSIIDKLQARGASGTNQSRPSRFDETLPYHAQTHDYQRKLSIQQNSRATPSALNSTVVFKKYKNQKPDDYEIYSDLKSLLDKENNQKVNEPSVQTTTKHVDLHVIQEKMEKIESDFLTKKKFLAKGMRPSQLINTNNKMEPMSKGPFLRTKQEISRSKERDSQELSYGYGHIGSPFDHPYQNWIEGLRFKMNKKQETDVSGIKSTKDELQYQKYLTDVKALNIVKEFLAENKQNLSKENKNQLITKIVTKERVLKQVEKNFKKNNITF